MAGSIKLKRNPFCIYYTQCLDFAAMQNLPEVPCLTCPHRESMHIDRDELAADAEGCRTLLGVIFFTDRGQYVY